MYFDFICLYEALITKAIIIQSKNMKHVQNIYNYTSYCSSLGAILEVLWTERGWSVHSGVTGGGGGECLPRETSDREIFADVSSFSLLKRRKFVLGLPKWEFSTGKKHLKPGKNQENRLCPLRKICLLRPWVCRQQTGMFPYNIIFRQVCDLLTCLGIALPAHGTNGFIEPLGATCLLQFCIVCRRHGGEECGKSTIL